MCAPRSNIKYPLTPGRTLATGHGIPRPAQSTPIVLAPREPVLPFFAFSLRCLRAMVSVHSHGVIQQLWSAAATADAVQPPDLRRHGGPCPFRWLRREIKHSWFAAPASPHVEKGGRGALEEKGRSYPTIRRPLGGARKGHHGERGYQCPQERVGERTSKLCCGVSGWILIM